MKRKYIMLEWPEICGYMEDPKWENVGYDPDKNVWFVPEDMLKK